MPGLGLLAPLFLLGSIAVAVPVVLHLLRQRADPVQPFSAVQLLQHSRVEQARRRRLRDLLLFVLRAAALVLLAIAFARPYLVRASPLDPPVTVVVADVSGSLSDPARLQRLRDLASSALDQAPASHLVALVQFASGANVLVAPTRDRPSAKAAAERLAPGFGSTSYRAGLAAAEELVARPGGRIVIVTDLQANGWTDGPALAVRADVPVDLVDVGPLPPDVALVGLDRDAGGRATARVRATSPARQVAVRFEVNGTPRGTAAAALDASGAGQASLDLSLAPDDAVRASVDDPRGLRADDERWLVNGVRDRPRVVIVAAPSAEHDSLYLQRALQALDGSRAVTVALKTGDRIQREGVPPGTAVVMLIGTAGFDRHGVERLAEYVRKGGGFVLAAGPAITPELLAAGFGDQLPHLRWRPGTATASTLVVSDVRHPALAMFAERPGAFADARFTRTAHLLGSDSSEVLARFDSGDPAIVASAYGKGRVAVIASDLGNRWNDLVLQPSFVPLVGELVHWASGVATPPETIVAGQSSLVGADQPGAVTLPSASGRPAMRVAVNADVHEFDAARMTSAEFLTRVPRGETGDPDAVRSAARRDESSRGLWRYALGLVLASLAAESLVGRRA